MKTYFGLKSLNSLKSYTIFTFIITALTFALLTPVTIKAETTIPLCEITRNLKVGDVGDDVRCLQRYLNWSGHTVAVTGAGSPGNESNYFGPLTASAVARWQNTNTANVLAPAGLTAGTGFWGPLSFNWYVSIVKTQLGISA